MRDLALLLTLTGMFVAVFTILYTLGTPARKLVSDTHELVSGDIVTFCFGNLSATHTVLSAGPSGVTLQSPGGLRSHLTHAVLANRQHDGLTIWKEKPDVQLP